MKRNRLTALLLITVLVLAELFTLGFPAYGADSVAGILEDVSIREDETGEDMLVEKEPDTIIYDSVPDESLPEDRSSKAGEISDGLYS